MKIGVLGGIGPESTGEFYNRLIKYLQNKKLVRANEDFPQIIVNSIPAPELIYDKISDKELKPYINGVKELDRMGVDFIVIVCNTIHLYYDRLQKEVNAPIINLRQGIKELLIKEKVNVCLVLGTANSIKYGLYKFEEIKTLEPNKKEEKQIADLIFNYNKGIYTNKEIKNLKKVCLKYLNKGAKKINLGCTALVLMLEKEDLPKIDTIDVLVDLVIEKFLQIR